MTARLTSTRTCCWTTSIARRRKSFGNPTRAWRLPGTTALVPAPADTSVVSTSTIGCGLVSSSRRCLFSTATKTSVSCRAHRRIRRAGAGLSARGMRSPRSSRAESARPAGAVQTAGMGSCGRLLQWIQCQWHRRLGFVARHPRGRISGRSALGDCLGLRIQADQMSTRMNQPGTWGQLHRELASRHAASYHEHMLDAVGAMAVQFANCGPGLMNCGRRPPGGNDRRASGSERRRLWRGLRRVTIKMFCRGRRGSPAGS